MSGSILKEFELDDLEFHRKLLSVPAGSINDVSFGPLLLTCPRISTRISRIMAEEVLFSVL